jgi:hypothetical protein
LIQIQKVNHSGKARFTYIQFHIQYYLQKEKTKAETTTLLSSQIYTPVLDIMLSAMKFKREILHINLSILTVQSLQEMENKK